jgi:hypothetical protein
MSLKSTFVEKYLDKIWFLGYYTVHDFQGLKSVGVTKAKQLLARLLFTSKNTLEKKQLYQAILDHKKRSK